MSIMVTEIVKAFVKIKRIGNYQLMENRLFWDISTWKLAFD